MDRRRRVAFLSNKLDFFGRLLRDDVYTPALERMGYEVVHCESREIRGQLGAALRIAIAGADVVVADVRGASQSVAHEIGLAENAGVPVLIVAPSSDDLFFNIKHLFAVFYPANHMNQKEAMARALQAGVARVVDEPRSQLRSDRVCPPLPVETTLDPKLARRCQRAASWAVANRFGFETLGAAVDMACVLYRIERTPDRETVFDLANPRTPDGTPVAED